MVTLGGNSWNGECCWRFATQTWSFKAKYHRIVQVTYGSHHCRVSYLRVEKIWFFPLVWDYDRCVREAFDIGEDGTRKHGDCTIDFMGLWVLFMFLLILYFRILDDLGKTSSLFSRPCSTALWSPRLFLLSTDFLAQFWHDKISCSHRTHTWLNVKHHPPMVDQISHLSHLYVPRPASTKKKKGFFLQPKFLRFLDQKPGFWYLWFLGNFHWCKESALGSSDPN